MNSCNSVHLRYIGKLLILYDKVLILTFRLILAGLVVSVKFNEEHNYFNSDYAAIGGVTAYELQILEREFLKLIDFDLVVSTRNYRQNKDQLGILYKKARLLQWRHIHSMKIERPLIRME
jgi:hypothetical protein